MKTETTKKRQTRKRTATKKYAEEILSDVTMPEVSGMVETVPATEAPAVEEPVEEQPVEPATFEPNAEQTADTAVVEEPVRKEKEENKEEKKDVVATPADGSKQDYDIVNNVSKEDTRALMNYLGVGMLPEEKNDMYWVRAVAKILKRDGSVSWCVLKRTSVDKHKIEKVFGNCSPIVKVGRPFIVDYIPKWGIEKAKNLDRQGKIGWIKMSTGKHEEQIDFDKLSDEEIDVELLKTEIKKNEIRQQK